MQIQMKNEENVFVAEQYESKAQWEQNVESL